MRKSVSRLSCFLLLVALSGCPPVEPEPEPWLTFGAYGGRIFVSDLYIADSGNDRIARFIEP